MDEGKHDPEKRASLRPPRPPRKFRPFRVLGRLLLFLVLLVLFAYIGLLLMVRTNGFTELASAAVRKHTGIELTIGSVQLSPGLDLTVRDVRLVDDHPLATGEILKAEATANWLESLRARRLQLSAIWLEGVTLNIVELSDGSREPLALTSLAGLEQWKIFVKNVEAPDTIFEAEELVRALEDTEAQEALDALKRSEGETPWWQSGNCPVHLRKGSLTVYAETGTARAQFSDVSYDFLPGVPNGKEGLRDPHHQLSGSYRMQASRPLQPMNVELIVQDGAWLFLNAVAGQELLLWLRELRADPVVAVAGLKPLPPEPNVDEHALAVPEELVLQLNGESIFRIQLPVTNTQVVLDLYRVIDRTIAENNLLQ